MSLPIASAVAMLVNTVHMSDAFNSSSSQAFNHVHICFVCTGNICRSPMAEVIAHDALEAAGLEDLTRTSSCGLGGWHAGQKADERTIAELRQFGHDGDFHRAAKLGPDHLGADIFIAMDDSHVDGLLAEGVSPQRIHMMRSFDHSRQKAQMWKIPTTDRRQIFPARGRKSKHPFLASSTGLKTS